MPDDQTHTPAASNGGPPDTVRADSSLRSIPVEITISVGRARPLIRDLLNLSENAVLALDRRIDDPVELFIGDRLIARGELQELDGAEPGQLAVRLTEVVAGPGQPD